MVLRKEINRNYMKKILSIVILVSVLSFMVSAADKNTNVYEYYEQNLSVEFIENSAFSQDIRQMIADSIAYNTPIPQTYSLCWLLGHDLYIEGVSAVYHKQSEYDPRCQFELYDVEKCRNCDYVYARLVSSQYISCCPPDASAVNIDDSHTH